MMAINRRKFLKIAGVSTLAGLAAHPAFEVLAPGELEASMGPKVKPTGEALHAERWAMAIDTTVFDHHDLEACVEACHKFHNVPDIASQTDVERKKNQEVKWIWPEEYEYAFPGQMNHELPHDVLHGEVLLMCNHCDNPPCVRVCPTKATFQREDGIVLMDMHRCIGCRFCMAACPYGARSFNFADPRKFMDPEEENAEYPTRMKGVVEKCNFCAERLAVGDMPLCYEAVKHKQGMYFGDLHDPDSEVRQVLGHRFSIRRKPELGTQPCVYYLI